MGGGSVDLSPLPWNHYGFSIKEVVNIDGDEFNVYRTGGEGVAIFCLHGAGYTGLSFARLAGSLTQRFKCQVIAPDLRGHGETKCAQPMELTKEQLSKDVHRIYEKLFPDENTRPYAFIIGHSMGGAVAIRVCHEKLIPRVLAVVVIDVVEGTAIAALADMPAILKHRPKRFQKLEEAIHWASTSLDCYCQLPGARQSVPSQFKLSANGSYYEWIIDLEKTAKFWVGWFTGISKEFLDCQQGKILIVGHVERLDSELIKAEIQGKFQNVIIPDAGHAIHENDPEAVSNAIENYYKRFAVLIEKGVKFNV